MAPSTLLRGVLAAVLGLPTVACYTYQPIDAPPVGSTVRVQVPVTSAISRPNAPPELAAIEGVLLSAGDTLTLATQTRREFGAYREIIQYDTLRLGRGQASMVEVREFSPRRSIVLGSTIALVAGTAAVLAFNSAGGSDIPDPNGNGERPAFALTSSLLSAFWGLIGG